ncbi:hypothetical protein B9Z55_016290 [Caenorhabditis nigoni]|uniref:Uncharacterized protein n=1 Tax=Caenorhabditis nigoni TaxID=1611254 RepID=A0A2G5UE99_9PELO|nr:hypothetical protein B9Z55_016290 [Caenorhabditis nigoni]
MKQADGQKEKFERLTQCSFSTTAPDLEVSIGVGVDGTVEDAVGEATSNGDDGRVGLEKTMSDIDNKDDVLCRKKLTSKNIFKFENQRSESS